MVNINENFLKLQDSYLFVTIAKKVSKFQALNPDKKVIKLGIGDVTRPLPPSIIIDTSSTQVIFGLVACVVVRARA